MTYLLGFPFFYVLLQIVGHVLLLFFVHLGFPAKDLVQLEEYARLVGLVAIAVGLGTSAKRIDVHNAHIATIVLLSEAAVLHVPALSVVVV